MRSFLVSIEESGDRGSVVGEYFGIGLAGYQIIEAPDISDGCDLADLYYRDGIIKVKPPQPPDTYWDREAEKYKPIPQQTLPIPQSPESE